MKGLRWLLNSVVAAIAGSGFITEEKTSSSALKAVLFLAVFLILLVVLIMSWK